MTKQADIHNMKQSMDIKALNKMKDEIAAKNAVRQPADNFVYNKAMLENLIKAKNADRASEAANHMSSKGTANTMSIDDNVEIKTTDMSADPARSDVTSKPEEASTQGIVNIFGVKINLHPKLGYFKEQYAKNFILSKSHNLLIAKFAELKLGFASLMLSVLGLTADDVLTLQRHCASSAIKQNIKNFEENEFASELLTIVGGQKKYVKTQKAVIKEIRNQLIKQCENLGLTGYFTKDKVLEIQLDQCRIIFGKFREEQISVEYQLCLYDSGIIRNENRNDIIAKLYKIGAFAVKADKRIETHMKTLSKTREDYPEIMSMRQDGSLNLLS